MSSLAWTARESWCAVLALARARYSESVPIQTQTKRGGVSTYGGGLFERPTEREVLHVRGPFVRGFELRKVPPGHLGHALDLLGGCIDDGGIGVARCLLGGKVLVFVGQEPGQLFPKSAKLSPQNGQLPATYRHTLALLGHAVRAPGRRLGPGALVVMKTNTPLSAGAAHAEHAERRSQGSGRSGGRHLFKWDLRSCQPSPTQVIICAVARLHHLPEALNGFLSKQTISISRKETEGSLT